MNTADKILATLAESRILNAIEYSHQNQAELERLNANILSIIENDQSISFEVAERIVKERMAVEIQKLMAMPDNKYPSISLDQSGNGVAKWVIYVDLMSSVSARAETIEAAFAALPSREEKKAARIAELEAELAKLNGEK